MSFYSLRTYLVAVPLVALADMFRALEMSILDFVGFFPSGTLRTIWADTRSHDSRQTSLSVQPGFTLGATIKLHVTILSLL